MKRLSYGVVIAALACSSLASSAPAGARGDQKPGQGATKSAKPPREAVQPPTAAVPPSTAEPVAVIPPPPSSQGAAQRREVEVLVAPGGGAFEIPVHAGTLCALYFFEPVEEQLLGSSRRELEATQQGTTPPTNFTVERWGPDAIAVLARPDADVMTMAVATKSRSIKVTVTLRVVPDDAPALSYVRFKLVTEAEAREAFVRAEVDKRLAPLRADLEKKQRDIEALIQQRAEQFVAENALTRSEVLSLKSIERNDENVIASARRAMVVGPVGYLFLALENRGSTPFRVARLEITADGKPVPGWARVLSSSIDKDPRILGVIQPGATARGVVVVRGVDAVMRKDLALELAGPNGQGAFRLTRGISFR